MMASCSTFFFLEALARCGDGPITAANKGGPQGEFRDNIIINAKGGCDGCCSDSNDE